MGNGSSAYPASLDAVTRIQDGTDYIEETDPNDAYATIEATQAFIGASGASQAHNTTILKQIVAIKPEILLSWKSTTELYASLGSVVCSNAAGTIVKLRANTVQTTITPSLGASTTYYVYAVADATATTVTFEVGTNASTAPTATTYRRIGTFKTNSSSQILEDSIISDGNYNLNFEKQTISAWINFNGTGTPALNDSFNISSITDNGTGDYTLNFSSDFADTNYCVLGTAGNTASQTLYGVNVYAKSVSSIQIGIHRSETNTLTDCNQISLAIIGDLA